MLNRNRLLSAQVTSGFSQWIDIFLIFSMPVFVWNANPEDIGFIALLFALPSILFSPIVGALADSRNPYRIMIIGAVLRVLTTFLIVINQSYILFLVLVFFKGISNVTYWASSSLVTNQVVDFKNRISYFSSLSAIDQSTKVLTPLVMIPIASFFSLKDGFILSLFLSLFALFAADTIYYKYTEQNKEVLFSYIRIFSGFKNLKFIPDKLMIHISFSMFLAFSLAIYDPHLPSFIRNLNMGENTYSIIISATAIGAVSGAMSVKFIFNSFGPILISKIGFMLFLLSIMFVNICLLTLGNIPLPVMLFIWFLNGCGYELFMIGYGVNFQNTCPKEILGKVSTSARSIQMLIIMLTPSVGAYFINNFSYSSVFLISLIILSTSLFISFYFKNKMKDEEGSLAR